MIAAVLFLTLVLFFLPLVLLPSFVLLMDRIPPENMDVIVPKPLLEVLVDLKTMKRVHTRHTHST